MQKGKGGAGSPVLRFPPQNGTGESGGCSSDRRNCLLAKEHEQKTITSYGLMIKGRRERGRG